MVLSRRKFSFIFIWSISLLFWSCANYKPFISPNEKLTSPISPPNSQSLLQTVFLIGDIGHNSSSDRSKVIDLLSEKLTETTAPSSVVFLGDNLSQGMPEKSNLSARRQAEEEINPILDILKDYKGNVFFIPGHQDWQGEDAVKSVQRQEEYIEDYLDRGDVFIPDDACGGPEVEDIGEHVALIAIDSQWWLQDWDEEPEINEKCDYKSREAFLFALGEDISHTKDKFTIVASHHPMYSNGYHGGYYTIDQHLFPLRYFNKDLYLPLPLLGSFFRLVQANTGSKQDLAHPQYKELRKALKNRSGKIKNIIFAAGHDHILQYYKRKDKHFVGSGSGSTQMPAAGGNKVDFSYGHQGFSQLDFYEDGTAWIKYWVTNPDTKAPIFQKFLFKKEIDISKAALQDSIGPELQLDSVITSIYSYDNPIQSKSAEKILGKHYRDLYFTPLNVPTANLKNIYGGLTPIKMGGGRQTNSLRAVNPIGKEYSIRSIKKDAKQFLPYPLDRTFAVDLVRDQFTAAHPFGAFSVPSMADALGIYHTNPQLYYIPKQPALDKYNRSYGDELYLVEERPDDDHWAEADYFGNSTNIIGSEDLREEMRESWKNSVDQKAFLKARLFDALIGDWDRHWDQWRWAQVPGTDDKPVYKPIPRDRDQVFARYDGMIMQTARAFVPQLRMVETFGPDFGNPRWRNYNGKWMDRLFLNSLSKKDWHEMAGWIEANFTDSVIMNAFKEWPDTVFNINQTGTGLINSLKSRRAKLSSYALDYYQILARDVNIFGTENEDYFSVERFNDSTRIRVYDAKDGQKDELFYERTFFHNETKSIVLYGLREDDIFVLNGKSKKGILIRIVGGLDKDIVIDESKVSGWGSRTKVYDEQGGIQISSTGEALDKTSNYRRENQYNFREFRYSNTVPVPDFGFNPDDGLFIGFGGLRTVYGFKKLPYSQSHYLGGKVATGSGAFDFSYKGEYNSIFGNRIDGLLNLVVQSPQYVVNFFGKGNETQNLASDFSFNRVKMQRYGLYPSIRFRLKNNTNISITPLLESVNIEKTPDRFIASSEASMPDRIFSPQWFGGIEAKYNFTNMDRQSFSHKGLDFSIRMGAITNLTESDRSFAYVRSMLAFNKAITPNNHLVFSTRVGIHYTSGQVDFFQGAFLGESYLRGFRRERFWGNAAYFNNLELRLKIAKLRLLGIPSTIGLFAAFDYGRVWYDRETSTKWHSSPGGGIWISPLNLFVLTTNYFHSEEGGRFSVALGFPF